MNYLLNLNLPLWWFFLPLIVAGYLASKKYKWKAMYYQTLDRYGKAKSEYHKTVEDLNGKLRNYVSLTEALQVSERLKIVTEKLHKAESDAAEREALIVQLRKDLVAENEILSGRISDKNAAISELNNQVAQLTDIVSFKDSVIQTDEATMKELRGEIEKLQKDANFNDGLINKYDEMVKKLLSKIEIIETDLIAAISVINRTKRATKQWAKIVTARKEAQQKEQRIELIKGALQKGKEQPEVIINDGRIEGVVHDVLGVAHPIENQKAGIVPESVKFVTVYKANQGENDNGRHDVMTICDEVNRGVKEQAELIKKELQQVDMSQLEDGDSVVLRNGIVKKVNECGKIDNDANYHTYISVDYTEGENWIFKSFIDYKQNGLYWHGKSISPYDIIQIIKQPKFDPQVGEKVKDIHYQNDEFYIVGKRNDEYLLNLESNGEPMISRLVESLLPIHNHTYKNGFICTK